MFIHEIFLEKNMQAGELLSEALRRLNDISTLKENRKERLMVGDLGRTTPSPCVLYLSQALLFVVCLCAHIQPCVYVCAFVLLLG